jgi:iron complex transport system substrate-binding protein
MMLACALVCPAPAASHPVAVTDDAGNRLELSEPAQRVVALSPALPELVFAAGGGDRLAAVVEGSNFPPAARSLPRIGDALALSVERVLVARPDLILAWDGGNNPRQLEPLRGLGIPVYRSRIERLEDVATTLERLGTLLGAPGDEAARRFRERLAALGPASTDGARPRPVRVFYQVWGEPLMTVNGRHPISDLIRRCGGANVFAALPALAPRVAVEAVVAAAPEAIIAAGHSPEGAEALARWRRFPGVPAVAGDFLFLVDGDAISRATPRMLDAGETICRELDQVRDRARSRTEPPTAAGCGRAGSCPGR